MYKALHFEFDPFKEEYFEILTALLDMYGFEGVVENENKITAYFKEEINIKEDMLNEIQYSLLNIGCKLHWKEELLPDQNWNKLWESNFEPITIGKQCAIRAPFHHEFTNFPYEIIIEPKMSFGTGHHQTTRLMIENMLEMDFLDKVVLDMGCGTGVLGILAALKKASRVVAIDIDKWACANATENARKNNTEHITVLQGDSELILEEQFDIILANINRNILLEQMKDYSISQKKGGILLLSGILRTDREILQNKAYEHGYSFMKTAELDDWITLMFERN